MSTTSWTTKIEFSKIECVISKIDAIDKIIPKVLQIEESAAEMKESLNSLNTRTRDSERLFQKNNQDLFTRIMNLERYSRDYNIRIIGVEEDEGEDCIAISLNYLTMLGFQDVSAEVENAHRIGKRDVNGLLKVC